MKSSFFVSCLSVVVFMPVFAGACNLEEIATHALRADTSLDCLGRGVKTCSVYLGQRIDSYTQDLDAVPYIVISNTGTEQEMGNVLINKETCSVGHIQHSTMVFSAQPVRTLSAE